MKLAFAWLKANPIIAGLLTAALVAIAIGGFKIYSAHRANQAQLERELNQDLGKTNERLEHNKEVLNEVQNANDAVSNPDPADVQRMRERFDRTRRQDGQ